MKKLFFLTLACMMLVLGCTEKKRYENTIAEFVQTDHRSGAVYDMKFKILQLDKERKITVADSVKYLNDKMEERRRSVIKLMEMDIDLLKNSHLPTTKQEQRLEAYKKKDLGAASQYRSRPKDEVLALAVKVKYSIVPPIINTNVEQTKYFILSPDGKTCYRQMSKLSF